LFKSVHVLARRSTAPGYYNCEVVLEKSCCLLSEQNAVITNGHFNSPYNLKESERRLHQAWHVAPKTALILGLIQWIMLFMVPSATSLSQTKI